jgi:hypothetical protein
VAFIERLVNAAYGLGPVAVEFFWSSLELPPGFLEMMDGRLDPRMTLRRRTWLGCGGSRSEHSRLRRPGLRVENQRQ